MNELWGATITSEDIPQGLSVDGVKCLRQVDEHGVEVKVLLKAFLLKLPHVMSSLPETASRKAVCTETETETDRQTETETPR